MWAATRAVRSGVRSSSFTAVSTFSGIGISNTDREHNRMSSQVTFKSNEDKAPQAGDQAPSAPRLSEVVRAQYTPSHGSAPAEMPQPPVGLEDLGPAAAIRVIGPDREKWL